MLHFIYRWERSDNGFHYTGMHSGEIDDGYIGSGTKFLHMYNKYKDKFTRSIISFHETREEALEAERLIIGENYKGGQQWDGLSLNLCAGGVGTSGQSFWNNATEEQREAHRERIKKAWANTPNREARIRNAREGIIRYHSSRPKVEKPPKPTKVKAVKPKKEKKPVKGQGPRVRKTKEEIALIRKATSVKYYIINPAPRKQSPERKEAISRQKKQEWVDPESKFNQPEFRSMLSATMTSQYQDPNSKLSLSRSVEIRREESKERLAKRKLGMMRGDERIEVLPGEVLEYLKEGWRFIKESACVKNDEHRIYYKCNARAAEKLLLSNQGWELGVCNEYERVNMKDPRVSFAGRSYNRD